MPTALIVGGSGKTARPLTKILSTTPASEAGTQPYNVFSIIRKPEQSSDIERLGAKPLLQSIEETTTSELADTMRSISPSVVIWCAGAGGENPERTRAVDHEGAIKAMDACVVAGIKRYITISALDVRDRETKPMPTWYNDEDKALSDAVWGRISPFIEAKLAADKELVGGNARRGLSYTIVRPGRLSEESASGTISAGKTSLTGCISREDVAKVVFECVKNDSTAGLAFDVLGGGVPIAQAVQRVANERDDTFEGFH